MPFDFVNINDDNKWALGCLEFFIGFPEEYQDISPAFIAIPVNQLNGLDAQKIGENVFSLVNSSKVFFAEVLASWVNQDGRLDWENILPVLEEFENESELIKKAAKKLRTIKEKDERRSIAKDAAIAKRIEIKNNYDKLFVAIGRRDGFNCAKCNRSTNDLQIDHIIPIAENGTNDLENLQLLCRSCNINKSDEYNV